MVLAEDRGKGESSQNSGRRREQLAGKEKLFKIFLSVPPKNLTMMLICGMAASGP